MSQPCLNRINMTIALFAILYSVTGLFIILFANTSQSAEAQPQKLQNDIRAPIATSGDNVYIAWPANVAKHWNIFFEKSVDSGKTFENPHVISAPTKGNVATQNVEIAASGSNVYVTWWTNQTGTFMPVFRASNDTGETFGKITILNGTR
jgi:hypothetical protein